MSPRDSPLAGLCVDLAPRTAEVVICRSRRAPYTYGLGATLHWMLAGKRPFAEVTEHGALVHAHIARVPPLLSDAHTHVPEVLARIVAKLLSKAADDRYRGVFGLRRDLERCLESLDASGEIPEFELARVDPAEHLQLGRRLYGREDQLGRLRAAVESEELGPRLLVVAGPSGSGKSALITSFHEDMIETGVVYAAGKFDQFSQHMPYAAVSQALRALLDGLVDEPTDAREDPVLERIREAIGPNGGLLHELAELLGQQPAIAPAGPGEARDRFLDTLARFEEVAAQLLTQASENAGADRSALLLERGGVLELHAELRAGAKLRVFAPPRPLAEIDQLLALPLVRAAARLDEAVIIDDVARDPRCRRDPYTLVAGPRSLCVMPIVKHGARVGLLYLENHLTPGAFSREHLGVLAILGSQAAITLDNARLFDALRESEEQWRSLVNSAPDAIMIADREHRVEFVNDRGLDTRAIQGATVEQLVAPDDREQVAAAIDYVFETGGYTAYDATIVTPDGRRSVTTRLGPIKLDGVVERVTLITTDVTERRVLEEQLRQAQKMQAVGTLAGGVAHDFNNLLTIILGACELAEFELPEAHAARELLDEIGTAAKRASELTGQLLAFSRKQVLQPRLLDLRTRVKATAKMLTRLIGEDIRFELETAAEPCLVRVDPGQVEQVLMNLAVNARDAMGDGGTLRVAVRPATSELDDERAGDPRVILEVADTGVGMRPELLERVFEPFFTTKQSGEGTGLGLPTVLGIIEQSGGQLVVDSEPGRGTRFLAYLPRVLGEALDHDAELPAELPRGSETVLVVEDEAAVRQLVCRLLERQGYTVLGAEGGEQALQLAAATRNIEWVHDRNASVRAPNNVELRSKLT